MPRNDGLPEQKRFPGEPPARFEYDRHVVRDVAAWVMVCPNMYIGDQAYSVAVYDFGVDPDKGEVARRRDGRPMDRTPVVAEEDTDELLERYERARRRGTGLNLNRYFVEGEDRPQVQDRLALGGSSFLPWVAGIGDSMPKPRAAMMRERRQAGSGYEAHRKGPPKL